METLNSFGISLISFLFVLGVLIFVHEFGHYAVAKLLKIRVDVFSLGFGKRLAGFKRGDTDYRLSLIPLGGYVKMAGENPDEELSGADDEFLSRPKSHRFAVVIAGPLMNLGLAVLFLAAFFAAGVPQLAYRSGPPLIGAVEPDSVAAQAGIVAGDRVVAIDGEATPSWEDLEFKIQTNPDIPLRFQIDREGREINLEVKPRVREGFGAGFIGITPFVPYKVQRVDPGSAAEEAGLRGGDEIVSLKTAQGTFSGFHQIRQVVIAADSQPLTFDIRRDGEIFEKSITPHTTEEGPRIGAYVDYEVKTKQYGMVEALRESVAKNVQLAELTFVTVGRIITGRASIKNMSGPIDIARFSGMAASEGWAVLISFMALVSLQLGLLNLLPIPILDGGVIALMAVEAVMRRDLSIRVKERLVQIGFLFLVALMCVVIFNDINKSLSFF